MRGYFTRQMVLQDLQHSRFVWLYVMS
jgi:hypothetical protein